MRYRVEVEGEYGVEDGSIRIMAEGDGEQLMWDSSEWAEDPSLVYVIAEAIRSALAEPGVFEERMKNVRMGVVDGA